MSGRRIPVETLAVRFRWVAEVVWERYCQGLEMRRATGQCPLTFVAKMDRVILKDVNGLRLVWVQPDKTLAMSVQRGGMAEGPHFEIAAQVVLAAEDGEVTAETIADELLRQFDTACLRLATAAGYPAGRLPSFATVVVRGGLTWQVSDQDPAGVDYPKAWKRRWLRVKAASNVVMVVPAAAVSAPK